MLVVPLLNSMMCSAGSLEGPIGVQKQEHPNQISFVECPASWLFQRAEAEGSVKGARWVRVHRSECGDPLRVLPPLPSPWPEAGHLTKEENWSSSLFLCACTLVGAGSCGEGKAPQRRGGGRRRHDRRLEPGRRLPPSVEETSECYGYHLICLRMKSRTPDASKMGLREQFSRRRNAATR